MRRFESGYAVVAPFVALALLAGCSGSSDSAPPTPDDDAGDDARDAAPVTCAIGSTTYDHGAANPANACQSCQPTVSTSSFTDVANGASCGTGGVCQAGACVFGCVIGGVSVSPGEVDPGNPCESCQPQSSTSAWSPADGANCGEGLICASKKCQAQCAIAGAIYAPGAANPTDACQTCQPGSSVSSWTSLEDGASCGASAICQAGFCEPACQISGTIYPAGATNPSQPCEACAPETSLSAWSYLRDGASCGVAESGSACVAHSCWAPSEVSGALVLWLNPDYGLSTTAWSDSSGHPSNDQAVYAPDPEDGGASPLTIDTDAGNGHPALVFNGSSGMYNPSTPSANLEFGTFDDDDRLFEVVVEPSVGGCPAPCPVFDVSQSDLYDNAESVMTPTSGEGFLPSGTVFVTATPVSATAPGFHVIGLYYSGSVVHLRVDGVTQATATNSDGYYGLGYPAVFELGMDIDPEIAASYFSGEIAEVIAVDSPSSADIGSVEAYLKAKYGL